MLDVQTESQVESQVDLQVVQQGHACIYWMLDLRLLAFGGQMVKNFPLLVNKVELDQSVGDHTLTKLSKVRASPGQLDSQAKLMTTCIPVWPRLQTNCMQKEFDCVAPGKISILIPWKVIGNSEEEWGLKSLSFLRKVARSVRLN